MTELGKIKLVSSDSQEFEVDREVAAMSQTIKNLLEAIEDENTAIPIENVKGEILERVIHYCEHHYNHPSPKNLTENENEYERRTDDIEPWDQTFCNVEQPILFELILAANYLDIKPLLDVCCKTVANLIKECRSPEEIRKRFKIKNDFTKEEEEEIRKENAWCLDEK
ncbi:s-phase kinase-associated protein [Anaeramoeba flamelloides]|uniref:S-phase kinase-associated protein n=1 Tax=Anaeramoeba flamelloides TaxID=1746091 RepID=A0AAV7YV85_9EUKA|nr:s-phase kinase-associated protein [Anaeramoeba flamelloides]KAJ3441733.1 s-phase kinase-associated protein [Anaeramoeba flamelloides]KAJ3441780.1 s-phase kinase-associated protein [Anaeramoeba flamelloides]KAJ3450620.1 s-phase kinase-associated protein [Anaeramoeba flamelloides]KAJ6231658.1 s-phase kinase-associated protein [Anaeramoeba flamelloides]